MKPFYEDSKVTILNGHVITELQGLPSESVHMVCTSPPYWGLRDYGLPPQVWDELTIPENGCTVSTGHEWGDEAFRPEGGNPNDGLAFTGTGAPETRLPGLKKRIIERKTASQGQFCQKCNAWRGSLGLEPSPELYIQHVVQVFKEIWRVLRKDGTVWLNLGDSYASVHTGGHKSAKSTVGANKEGIQEIRQPKSAPSSHGLKEKDLCGIPWRVALALQAAGWWLRSAMPWVKRSAMPESVTDRPASALEYVFLLTKSEKYYFDMEAIRIKGPQLGHYRKDGRSGSPNSKTTLTDEEMVNPGFREKFDNPAGRNFRNTDLFYRSIEPPHGMIFAGEEPVGLDVNPQGFAGAHFATFAEALVTPLIKAGTSEKGCCPECGANWTRMVEIRPEYKTEIAKHYDNWPSGLVGKGIKRQPTKHPSQLPEKNKTIGWRPSCEHKDLKPVPCIVCDPFGGSGRTAIVAKKLGRKCIIIELKPEYCEMSLDELRQENIF